jgi:hypothetical protein
MSSLAKIATISSKLTGLSAALKMPIIWRRAVVLFVVLKLRPICEADKAHSRKEGRLAVLSCPTR